MKKWTQQYSTHLHEKILLRQTFLPQKPIIHVLDAFHGKGVIWDTIRDANPFIQFRILGIDAKPHKKTTLKGDNLKYLSTLNLDHFDIIDLDAFGCPYPQLEILFRRQYAGRVFVTMIQSGMGRISQGMLVQYGYTKDMIKQCPTLFNHDGLSILKHYLALHNIKDITYFLFQEESRKIYLTFSTL